MIKPRNTFIAVYDRNYRRSIVNYRNIVIQEYRYSNYQLYSCHFNWNRTDGRFRSNVFESYRIVTMKLFNFNLQFLDNFQLRRVKLFLLVPATTWWMSESKERWAAGEKFNFPQSVSRQRTQFLGEKSHQQMLEYSHWMQGKLPAGSENCVIIAESPV